MNKGYHIILYLRISTEDVDVKSGIRDESYSIGNQRAILQSFISSNPEFKGSILTEICDDGYTGTNFNRPGVTELLQRAKEKRVDCIIVKDFSRFGRDYLTVSDYVDQIFPLLGIRFISINDNYDSNNLNGTASGLNIAFRNLVYAYYSKDISEKVRSGKRAKARQGAYMSAFAPLGYQKDKDDKNHLVVDKKAAEIVQRIFEMCGAGFRVVEIVAILNAEHVPTPSQLKKEQGLHHKWWQGLQGKALWDISRVTRILRDERYLGKAVYGRKGRAVLGDYRVKSIRKEEWIVVPDAHEAIVTAEVFEAAQRTLKEYVQAKNKKSSNNLFAGKIRCGVCQYALIYESRGNPRYRCATPKRAPEYDCMQGSILRKDLEEVVWQSIRAYCMVLLDKKEREKRNKEYNPALVIQKQIVIYQGTVKCFAEQKAILYEKMLDGDLSREQYMHKRDALLEKQKVLQQKIDELDKKRKDYQKLRRRDSPSVKELKEYLQADRLTHEMVEAFVDCVYVYRWDCVKVTWLFEDIYPKSLLNTTRGG